MEKNKTEYSKPRMAMERFMPQEFIATCELVPGVKLYWAMSQEQNDISGRQETEQATQAGYLYMNPDTDVQFIEPSTYEHDANIYPGYYQFNVTSYQFYKKEGNTFVKTANPFISRPARDQKQLYNIFYRLNIFTEGSDVVINENTKNVS